MAAPAMQLLVREADVPGQGHRVSCAAAFLRVLAPQLFDPLQLREHPEILQRVARALAAATSLYCETIAVYRHSSFHVCCYALSGQILCVFRSDDPNAQSRVRDLYMTEPGGTFALPLNEAIAVYACFCYELDHHPSVTGPPLCPALTDAGIRQVVDEYAVQHRLWALTL